MTSTDLFIIFGPFIALTIGMAITFGIVQYLELTND
jgi:hypothetical protein